MTAGPGPYDQDVGLPGGPRLALRRWSGREDARPVLLVHGLASNARVWDGVSRRLAAAGHPVVALDQRGHGRSAGLEPVPADGYDTDTCADDLAALVAELGWTGARRPVVAGQSWGGNVVLAAAARHGVAAALGLVDGGWIRLADRFPTFEECWAALAPPSLDGARWVAVEAMLRSATAGWPAEGVEGTLANLERLPGGGVRARLARNRHREIVRSLWTGDPRPLYGRVDVPVLLAPALPAPPDRDEGKEAALAEAVAGLADVRVSRYDGAHHDLHAQQPQRLAADLLALATAVRPTTGGDA